jgi:hypothetical protein
MQAGKPSEVDRRVGNDIYETHAKISYMGIYIYSCMEFRNGICQKKSGGWFQSCIMLRLKIVEFQMGLNMIET